VTSRNFQKLLQSKWNGGIGFKDMHKFNQALLAWQAWRLIQFSDSLCARLLKAKYYPNVDLVDTVFPGEASPTWKAIEHGLELVKKGVIWRIRSGAKVSIWRDPWIPRPPSFKITLRKGRSWLRWVSQLMKNGSREWDEQKLDLCLYPHDKEEVLKIRPMQQDQDDVVAWFYEESGIFTIKSAYQLVVLLENANDNQGGSGGAGGSGRPIYKSIWNAEVPPKRLIFAWKLAVDGLATQEKRMRRGLFCKVIYVIYVGEV
jgi:hypothetical protein